MRGGVSLKGQLNSERKRFGSQNGFYENGQQEEEKGGGTRKGQGKGLSLGGLQLEENKASERKVVKMARKSLKGLPVERFKKTGKEEKNIEIWKVLRAESEQNRRKTLHQPVRFLNWSLTIARWPY